METTVDDNILGIHREYWGYVGILEKKMETAIVYWGRIRKYRVL